MTFCATVNAVIHAGGVPGPFDIEPGQDQTVVRPRTNTFEFDLGREFPRTHELYLTGRRIAFNAHHGIDGTIDQISDALSATVAVNDQVTYLKDIV